MDIKKDPGKFTIRFCMADPRQKKAVAELNAQGRLKAQFLTNAICITSASKTAAAYLLGLSWKQSSALCWRKTRGTAEMLPSYQLGMSGNAEQKQTYF